jgi:hypothetical protein
MLPERGANALISFDGGYVAYGETDQQMRAVARFSADGRDWASVELAGTVPCGSVQWPAASVRHGATNGSEVVLVGSEWPEGSRPCDGNNSRDTQPVAWITSDGKTWQRSAPMLGALGSWPTAHIAWAIPGGWEAAIGDAIGPNVVWQSSDGHDWHQVAEMDQADDPRLVAGAANPAGIRLILLHRRDAEEEPRYLMLSSADGRAWDEVAHLVRDGWGQYWILPGFPGTRDPWVVITGDGGASVVSTSFDLDTWERQPVPMPAVEALARTRYGLLAVGWAPEPVDVPTTYTTYISADALHWSRLDSEVQLADITDGPAGVIGIGPDNGERLTVWRLDEQ